MSEGGLFTRRIDQDGRTPLLASSSVSGVEDWTHDGRFVIFLCGTGRICALPLKGDRTPVPLIESSSSVDEPHVSPDGRWLAYSGNDTGQWEVYVQPFMRPGGRVRVSTNGGSQAHWRGDGRELFYLALDGTMMSVRTADPASSWRCAARCFDCVSWSNPYTTNMTSPQTVSGFWSSIPRGSRPPG